MPVFSLAIVLALSHDHHNLPIAPYLILNNLSVFLYASHHSLPLALHGSGF